MAAQHPFILPQGKIGVHIHRKSQGRLYTQGVACSPACSASLYKSGTDKSAKIAQERHIAQHKTFPGKMLGNLVARCRASLLQKGKNVVLTLARHGLLLFFVSFCCFFVSLLIRKQQEGFAQGCRSSQNEHLSSVTRTIFHQLPTLREVLPCQEEETGFGSV